MRNLILLSLLSVFSFGAKAQSSFSLNEGQTALVYSLPKTEFIIEIETEKTSQKPGVFYRYSERYLATNKVITEEKTTFRLKNIKVKTRAIADSSRTFSFIPNLWLQTYHLSVNSQGILCGVNVTCEPEKPVISASTIPAKGTEKTDQLLPLGEEYMLAGSEAKLAEGVSKQIYRVRERRLSLLTADVDKLPADGDSFKTMMDGLSKLERDLTELFTGKTTVETQSQTISLIPSKALNNQVLFRLSAQKGIVAADDLSGIPFYINVLPATVTVNPADPKARPEKVALYYVLPASTQVTITDGVNTLYNSEYFVPQFGKTILLPESIFRKRGMKLHIDCQTGRLQNIE
ncbi:MAG: DUF4831 family protein [Paludibacter sp.]